MCVDVGRGRGVSCSACGTALSMAALAPSALAGTHPRSLYVCVCALSVCRSVVSLVRCLLCDFIAIDIAVIVWSSSP